jgi:hypothetical protein
MAPLQDSQETGARGSCLCRTGGTPVVPVHGGVGEEAWGRGQGPGPTGPGSTGFQPVGTPLPHKKLFVTAPHGPLAYPQSRKTRVGRAPPAAKHRLIGVKAL